MTLMTPELAKVAHLHYPQYSDYTQAKIVYVLFSNIRFHGPVSFRPGKQRFWAQQI